MLKLKYNNLKKYVFLVVICVLYSCQQHHRMGMDNLTNLLGIATYNHFDKGSEYERLISPPSPVVVLLHRKDGYISETNEMQEKLNEEFGDKIKVIQLGWKSRSIRRHKAINKAYKQIASSLLHSQQYGKDGKSVSKAIHVHIFGFDEKAKSLGHDIIQESNRRKNWWFQAEEWQFPFKIKTLSYINYKNKKDAEKSKFLIKSFKGDNFIPDYINFLKEQLAYNECTS